MRKRDPRRIWHRKKEVVARVTLVKQPEGAASADGSVTTKQVADVSMPKTELDRIWTTEYLERLARTYWHFLTRISLGILKVRYGPDSREIVVLTKPFVLLRFHAPVYETTKCGARVTWPINKGLLVAPQGRGKGYLRIEVEHVAAKPSTPPDQVTIRVSSEVGNFYPLIAGWGWFSKIGRFVYKWTQLAIHVVVTNLFLESLATLDLKESVIGRFRHVDDPLPTMDEPDEPPQNGVAENVASSSLLPHR